MIQFDIYKLTNLRKQSNGSFTAQCPICAAEGHDKKNKNHLIIFPNNAFNCIKAGPDDREHNRAIRRFLLADEDNEIFLLEPQIKFSYQSDDKVYPEDTLKKLIRDYTYWQKRGVKPEVIELLEGGVSEDTEKNKLSGRFIFPIRDKNRRIVGFTGRLIKENNLSPKWKHLFKSGKVCWPWHISGEYVRKSKSAILVESIGDLLALYSHGIYNVICIFGLNLNSEVIGSLIGSDVNNIIISLNNDKDANKGQLAATKLKDKLSKFFSEDMITIKFPTSKDWGEASQEEINSFKEQLSPANG